MSKAIQELVDREAEQAVLGACLIDPDQLIDVMNIVAEDAFWLDGHRHIFKAMVSLFEASQPIDIISLANAIRANGTSVEHLGNGTVRGTAYLAQLMADCAMSYHAGHYAGIVRDMARRREVVTGCQMTANQAMDLGQDLSEIIEGGCQNLLKVSVNGTNQLRPMGDDLGQYTETLRNKIRTGETSPAGLPTGYADIDQHTLGLEKQKLYIVAGRPGMGKTAWLIGLTHHLSVEHNYHGAIFSLEMSRDELYKRLIAYQSKVDLQQLGRGAVTGEQAARAERAMVQLELAKSRIWIDDEGGLTPSQMRARAAKMQIQNHIDYLWIDFLQLIRVPEARGPSQQYIAATVAARELKNLAKALDIPVIAACQLSRRTEERNDRRPELPDLRDSGAIEEAADLVGFLWRQGYYQDTADPNMAYFIIGKQRDGPSGKDVKDIPLTFLGQCAGYYDYAKQETQ